MNAPSNEVLDQKFKDMKEQNNTKHTELKEILTKISDKVDNLDKKFVLRREFTAVSAVIGILAIGLWIIGFFIWK